MRITSKRAAGLGTALGFTSVFIPYFSTQAIAADGTFTGPVIDVTYGDVQVQITILNGRITDAVALKAPSGNSQRYSDMAIPILRQQTLVAQSDQIQGASGASYTSYGWYKSLQGAIAQANAVDAAADSVNAAIEAVDAANAATDAANAAAEAMDGVVNLQVQIDEAISSAKLTGQVIYIEVDSVVTYCNQKITDFTKNKDYAESRVLAIKLIIDRQNLEPSTRAIYGAASTSWSNTAIKISKMLTRLIALKDYLVGGQEKINTAAAEKGAADLKAKQEADANAAAVQAAAELKAKQDADAKAAADKAAAEIKAKQDADAKAAADKAAADLKAKQDSEAKAAADKAAADLKAKQDSEAKAAADKTVAELKAKQDADAKAAADKTAAELKAKQDADAKAVADKTAADLKAKQVADAKEVNVLVTNFKKRVQSRISDLRLRLLAIKNMSANDRKKSEQLQKDLKLVSTELTLISGIGPAISELDDRTAGLVDQVVALEARYKKTTITCIKGKTVKKVTAVKPVCPAGYKKK